jgi:uncharacterized BrkB/YihY/UPF0761 family membrane protein
VFLYAVYQMVCVYKSTTGLAEWRPLYRIFWKWHFTILFYILIVAVVYLFIKTCQKDWNPKILTGILIAAFLVV